ncbi:hypothetical protein SAMN05445504_3160 [Burkholderia sp. CF099]|nr:hypothetical protein SAMN05445504_3160 [Burkholderia sp. CF099]
MDTTSLTTAARAALPVLAAPGYSRPRHFHYLVFPTSKKLEQVAAQLIQAETGGRCMRVAMPDQYSTRGTAQNSGAEAGFKDLLAWSRGILTVAREQTKNFFEFLLRAKGVVNTCTQIYIFVMQGDEGLGAEIISELIASGAEPAKITVVLCSSTGTEEDHGVFADMQTRLFSNQVQNVGIHPHVIPNLDLLSNVSRTDVLIGDFIHGTHDFAEDVATERRKGFFDGDIYKALDGLVLQFEFHAQRHALLDALEGLTASRISSQQWYEMIYHDPYGIRTERSSTPQS